MTKDHFRIAQSKTTSAHMGVKQQASNTGKGTNKVFPGYLEEEWSEGDL